eukprot:jgi/Psemu1/283006/fgenesh1_pg.18_\
MSDTPTTATATAITAITATTTAAVVFATEAEFAARAEQKWSRAADSYARYFEPMTVTAGRSLLGMLKLRFQEATAPLSVLEAGCGAGGLARELLLDASAPNSSLSVSELVLTDLSEGMLERARAAIGPSIEVADTPKVTVTIEAADFSDLSSLYPPERFDRYYSNLCLHYARDPDAVIAEAARVLRPGGIAGFTVWGKRSASPVMTIVPDILERFAAKRLDNDNNNNNNNNKRSSFHMGEDDDALRRRFVGDDADDDHRHFARCTVVHYPAVLESLDADDYVRAILDGAPSTKKELEECYNPADQRRIREMVRDRAEELLAGGEPLVLDLAVVVAQK